MLKLTADLNNAGKVEANNILTIQAATLNNTGGISAYEISRQENGNLAAGLVLSGGLNNAGTIRVTNNLLTTAASLWNGSGAQIQAAALSAIVGGDIYNSGILLSDSILILSAANLTNAGTFASTATISGKDLQITLANHLNNAGYSIVQGLQSARVTASTANLDLFHANGVDQGVFNYGKDLALTLYNQGLTIDAGQSLIVDGSLALTLGQDVTVNGVLAARNDLFLKTDGSLTVGIDNIYLPGGGEIFTMGNMELITGGNLTNTASTIQSMGDMVLNVGGTLTNKRTDQLVKFEATFNPSRVIEKFFPDIAAKYTEYWVSYSETSQAAQIMSGGNLVITTDALINDASIILASKSALVKANSIQNLSRETGVFRTVEKTKDGEDPDAGSYNGWLNDGEFMHIDESAPEYKETTGLIYAGITLNLDAPNGATINTGNLDGSTVIIDSSTLINGITDPNRPTAPSRLPDPVIDLSNYFTGPSTGGVGGLGAGNRVTIGNVTYLNASPFAGAEDTKRGPIWILEQVGDIRDGVKIFADPTNEQRMLNQALLDQTGSLILDPRYRTPEEQQEALWQGTVDFLKANPDIKLGDELTAEQRANLSEPILWYVTQNINGEDVLVPQLVLPTNRLEEWRKSNGGVITADNLYITGDNIYNSGAMLAESTLSIDAGTFTNERRVVTYAATANNLIQGLQDGGFIAGDIVQIRTSGDLMNIGGTIIADSGMNIVAGGDLILTASVVENRIYDGSKKNSVDISSTTNYGGTLYSGGDMSLYAANDIRVEGSNVIALGNASILAGNEITITSLENTGSDERSGTKGNVFSKKSWSSSDSYTQNVSSTIVAGGDLTVAAAGNVNIHASDLIAGEDIRLAAGAGENGKADASVNITAGQDSESHGYSQTKSGLFGGGSGWADIWHKKTTTDTVGTITNVASNISAGGNVTITANNDINIQGSTVSAGDTASLDAGNNINITPGSDGYTASHKKLEQGVGIGGSANSTEAKVQVGYHSNKTEVTMDSSYVVSSVIQGGNGVVMNAGNDINIQAGVIRSPGDISLTAGHDINTTVAYDMVTTTSKQDEKFIGVTAKGTANILNVINSLKQATETFKSGHGGAAYEAIGMVSGVLKATDAIKAASGGLAGVSASLTIGGEGKKSSLHEELALAHGTTLDAGGNLSLNAGNNIHLIGTDAKAGNDLNLVAGNDIIIESAQSYNSGGYKSQQWNAGIGIGASIGATGPSVGLQIEGGFGKSDSENWGIQQENSYLSAGNSINIKSGNDTTIAGAVISAPDISLDVGNNLTVQSRQDTGHAEGSSVSAGGSITIGAGVTGGVSVGFGDSDSDVAWVTEQTGIYADDKLDIKVGNHTQLDGSVLNSDTGNLTLDTGTLGWTTIKDHDKGDAFDMTLSASTGVGKDENNNPQQVYGGSFGGRIEGHDREQDTNATVGEGNIIIRNQDQQVQDVATLNRDLDQAQVITKDESWGTQFYGSDTSIAEALNGFQNIPQDIQNMVNNTLKGIDVLGKTADQIADALLNKMVDEGKIQPEDKPQAIRVKKALLESEEARKQASACLGQTTGFNFFEFFVTTAHASSGEMCRLTYNGVTETVPKSLLGRVMGIASVAVSRSPVIKGLTAVVSLFGETTMWIGGVEPVTWDKSGIDGSGTLTIKRTDGSTQSINLTATTIGGAQEEYSVLSGTITYPNGTSRPMTQAEAIAAAQGIVGATSGAWSVNNADQNSVPEKLVGTIDSKSSTQGKRQNNGPLDPKNGGSGDPQKDFDLLTGGKSEPAPATYPPGSKIGPNGIVYRPGQNGSGPRIDIPANGLKPHETLHY
ncbi:hemagglutinin repeat-containing protein [Microvirga sp. W0021]|uniref:Hemagglutinin repeat-containing protein n=1 Tax=Hohaiivirga grylli TaxID=3133970 RepID=A0ABV0BN96_9HYPH